MAGRSVPPHLLPVETLNLLPREKFASALAPLFEAPGPLAEALFGQRPYRSYDELLERAESVVGGLSTEQKIEVVSSHPRIGESAEAVQLTSVLSYREQGYDRETGVDREELEAVYRQLADLNHAYEARFGFRFVVFVNRRPKSEIVEVLRARLGHSRDEEIQIALRDMLAIARDRLSTLQRHTDVS